MAASAISMKFWLLILPLLCGCNIAKFNKPPVWASAVIHHSRFTGLNASYNGTGVKFGWGSDVWEIIPVSTNKVFTAQVSDTFKLTSGLNPWAVQITEDVVSGWEGNPPTPRYYKLFSPLP
jgi:hypothetical protein